MTIRAFSRTHVGAAVGGLILATTTVPGAATENTLEQQGPGPANMRPGEIATIAGTGEGVEYGDDTDAGDGGPATEAPLGIFLRMDVGPDGTVYVADVYNEQLRVIHPDGTIDTLSGDSQQSPDGDGWSPSAVAVDADGRVYVANDGKVQRADKDGDFKTIAGGSDRGDGASATEAQLLPSSIDIGPDNALYIGGLDRIHKITADGDITTIAGGGDVPFHLFEDEPATDLELSQITDIAVDSQGTVYFSVKDSGSYIFKIDADGTFSKVAGADRPGFSGDGGPATEAQLGEFVGGLTVDAHDQLLFLDGSNQVVRRIDTDGVINTIDGSWFGAGDLATAPDGDLYLAGMGQIALLGMNAAGLPVDDDAAGEVEPGEDPWAGEDAGATITVAEKSLSGAADVAIGADGSIYAVNATAGTQLVTASPAGDVVTLEGGSNQEFPLDGGISEVETGNNGRLYLAVGTSVVRLYPDGTTSVVAGTRGLPARAPYDGQLARSVGMGGSKLTSAPDGTTYLLDQLSGGVYVLNADGTLNTVAEQSVAHPLTIAADSDENVYVVEGTTQSRISKIDSSGAVSTFASDIDPGVSGWVRDVAVHPDGTVYISTLDDIRTVDADGATDPVVEFDDSNARANEITFDTHGNLYYSAHSGDQVRVLVRPAEMSEASESFPWWIIWVSAAAIVLAGGAVLAVRRRQATTTTA